MKSTSPNVKGFLLPNLCSNSTFLLLLMAAELIVIAFVLFECGWDFNWVYLGQVTLYVQWQIVLTVLILCRLRAKLAAIEAVKAAALAYAIVLLTSLAVALVSHFIEPSFNVDWVMRNVALTAILGGLALRYLYIQQKLIEREKSMLQASITALQAKMRPHFLFNTMNSIASLIGIDGQKAEKMVEDLSTLLRASLRANQAEITLQQEWELCQRYLEIEQIRLGERLRWESDFKDINMQVGVPSFSIQPLVENAIYHGIQPYGQQGKITIKAQQQGNKVHIQVINSQGNKETGKKHKGNQLAINNIRLRLVQLYGESARLELIDHGPSFEAHMYYENNKKAET